jgi:uncharacterized protein with FMN-binding domain
VRKVTKNIVGVLSLGVLATSWSLGQAAETGLSLGAGTTNTDTSASPTASPTPEATASATPAASATASAAASATPTPTKSATATPTPTPTKTATASAASVTKTSAAISYIAKNRQGVMQISVTKTGSKITDVTIISGGTEGGEWAVVPDMLAQAAIDAQGSNFGNISRATHTTDAFKQALESALAKF